MKYELTIIINGKATAAKKKKIIENVTDIVKTNKEKFNELSNVLFIIYLEITSFDFLINYHNMNSIILLF